MTLHPVVQAYVEKRISITKAARECGLGYTAAHRRISKAGVMRSISEAQRIRRGKDPQLREAVALVQSGEASVKQAAERTGVSRSALRQRLKAESIERPSLSEGVKRSFGNGILRNPNAREAMRFLHEDGMELGRIARAWGVAPDVVERIMEAR